MNIREIAEKINEESQKYQFGKLQDLRKDIKGLSKKASSMIFTDQTISDDGWAFHHGGRKEIQFNIGLESEGLRYGIAFSLETSRSLPDLSVLYPKILKLNSLIRNEPELFVDYKMWFWRGKRSKIGNVQEIDSKLVQNGTFIFIGKLMDVENLDYDKILSTFDDLLNIYQEVETESKTQTEKKQKIVKFKFDNRTKHLPQKSNYNTIEKEINIDVRHSYLQEKLYEELIKTFGEDAVGMENRINGNRIDVVVKTEEDSYIFYEVKTGSSAKSCIRQAIGQLFEYAFWNNSNFKVDVIIAGEFEMDKTTSDYMKFLKSNFSIPISYHCIR
ncbi:MAG: hypothetical protein AB7U05_09685 [Mangrovibacterium sp.]